ncbi:exported hypothetical protein [Vibrio nigripulchritudo SO65]|nr:exported hypothetical protein [Vibrio nigripulchritudo SO65]
MKMSKYTTIAVVTLAAMTTTATQAETVFRYGHTNSANHFVHAGAESFKSKVETETNGRVKIEIFPNSQLGGNEQSAELISFGSPMIGQVNPSVLSSYDNRFDVLSYPFLFKSTQQAGEFLKSDFVSEWERKPANNNIDVLCYFSFGARDLYTRNKPVHDVADSKGMKVRVQPLTMYTKMVENSYSAVPTPMPWAEVYNALSLGVIDAAEAPPQAMLDQKHFEVTQYYMQTQHIMDFSAIIASKSTIESMSKGDQVIFRNAAKAMCDAMTTQSNALYESSVAELETKGMKIIRDVNRAAFAEGAKNIHKSISGWDKDFYNEVLNNLN